MQEQVDESANAGKLTNQLFSLVIPVYKNESSLTALLAALTEVKQQMGGGFEAVFVIDGSPDRCFEILAEALPQAEFDSQLILLSRNYGSFQAITAGLSSARGAYMGVIAADLQEPPELVLSFRQMLLTEKYDVVVGTRAKRADPWLKRLFSFIFWRTYRLLVQKDVPPRGVDVFACTRAFAAQLLALKERNTTLVGLIFWLGYRRGEVSYERRARQHGVSAWSFQRRLRYLLDSTFAFSDLPVRMMSLIGLSGMGLSLALGMIILLARLLGWIEVPGYTATALLVIFFGGLNSLGIGLIGEYVWRTFENTKGRPNFLIAQQQEYQAVTRK
ncbi:MAG: glycosyltransferase family 2 protein [Acidobacteria bacterium]|nr:glycosyltransferase family 2 protein [Acidobacteriota bacterium]